MPVPRYEKCTIWTSGEYDPIEDKETLGDILVYTCESAKGGKTSYSSNGVEFYPKSTFWLRSGDIVSGTHQEPQEGWLIARGDHSGVSDPSTVGAEPIKGVMVHSNAKFGEADSYTVGTA
ncbi:hypothetical protein [Vibrio phage LP.1]|nr:hypothetical protein [Vibrio phage LP.1]